jgi:hypothetical protein
MVACGRFVKRWRRWWRQTIVSSHLADHAEAQAARTGAAEEH